MFHFQCPLTGVLRSKTPHSTVYYHNCVVLCCDVATPHLTAAPAVKKELLMRFNDADNATCLDLAHTDHYTFETSSSCWFPEPQHDCWIPGLVIKACLPNKGKTPVTIRITGHRLVCSESHFRVIVKQHALPDCVVAGKYDLCKLSVQAESNPEGLTTCAATCVCEGVDGRHVTIHIPKMYEDWKICELPVIRPINGTPHSFPATTVMICYAINVL